MDGKYEEKWKITIVPSIIITFAIAGVIYVDITWAYPALISSWLQVSYAWRIFSQSLPPVIEVGGFFALQFVVAITLGLHFGLKKEKRRRGE